MNIFFSLVPENATDAVREFRLPNPPEQSAIDGGNVFGIRGVALMHIDSGAADGAVDYADRHLLAFDQSLGQLHTPIADL